MSSQKKSSDKEMVFKPKYPARIMLTVYLYPLGMVIFFLFIYMAVTSHRIFPYGLFALVFGFTLASMPLILFREIHFFDDRLILKRYFFPARTILYQDIINLTSRGLVARRGGVPLVNVQNRKEFEKTIHRLVARQKIILVKE